MTGVWFIIVGKEMMDSVEVVLSDLYTNHVEPSTTC